MLPRSLPFCRRSSFTTSAPLIAGWSDTDSGSSVLRCSLGPIVLQSLRPLTPCGRLARIDSPFNTDTRGIRRPGHAASAFVAGPATESGFWCRGFVTMAVCRYPSRFHRYPSSGDYARQISAVVVGSAHDITSSISRKPRHRNACRTDSIGMAASKGRRPRAVGPEPCTVGRLNPTRLCEISPPIG